jgi:2-methylfumaryl-CoA isomerase
LISNSKYGINSTQADDGHDYNAPLSGLRIIELSTYVAGPSCGVALAQLGADVIRIDPIGGATDFHRLPLDAQGESLYWAGLNQAKRSVEVDISSVAGRAIVHQLLRSSGPDGGILLTNAVSQPWLSYEQLVAHRSDLIQILVQGRHDGRPAVDYTVNCETGLPLITGPKDFESPVNHVLPAWDLLTGLHAAIGILSAERVRSQTGRGQFISVSLSDVAVSTMGLLGFLGDVALNGRGRLRDGNYLYGSFGCDFKSKDGRQVMIVALTEKQWVHLKDLTGTGEIIDALERSMGVDLTSEEVRYRYRELLVGLFRPWFESRDFSEITAALNDSRVLWGPYLTVEELVDDPSSILNQSPVVDMVERPGVGIYPSPRGVLRQESWAGRKSVASPRLGQHTAAVLTELLNLAPREISKLQEDGIVGGKTS